VSFTRRSILPRACAAAIVATAVPILIGAADQLGESLSRLQGMSPQQRIELADALRRFDLQLSPEDQKSIRKIDEQIHKLSEVDRARYLATLRRYHNWLDTLPDTVREDLLAKVPEARMALIKTLLAKYPIPPEKTPYWMQFTELGDGSPFDLAAIFRLWQDLTPEERRDLDGLPTAARRREELNKRGLPKRTFQELRRADFRIEEWIPKVDLKVAEFRGPDPELKAAIARAEKNLEDLATEKPLAKLRNRAPILRRLAINLFLLSRDPPHPVPADRLDAFLAALPTWVQSSFDPYPADEARRRLTLAYRLVFPYPNEFEVQKPVAKSKGSPISATKSVLESGTGQPAPIPPSSPAPGKEPRQRKAPPKSGSSPF
jgi:hypothetical protein